LEQGDHAFHIPGIIGQISIHHDDIVSPGLIKAGQVGVPVSQLIRLYNPCPAGAGQVGSIIGGAVRDQDLAIQLHLEEDLLGSLDALTDGRGFISGGNDQADIGHILMRCCLIC